MNSKIDPKTGLLVKDHRRVDLDLYFFKCVVAEIAKVSLYRFDKLDIKPDKAVTNPRHPRGPIAYLYDKRRIQRLLPEIRLKAQQISKKRKNMNARTVNKCHQ